MRFLLGCGLYLVWQLKYLLCVGAEEEHSRVLCPDYRKWLFIIFPISSQNFKIPRLTRTGDVVKKWLHVGHYGQRLGLKRPDCQVTEQQFKVSIKNNTHQHQGAKPGRPPQSQHLNNSCNEAQCFTFSSFLLIKFIKHLFLISENRFLFF